MRPPEVRGKSRQRDADAVKAHNAATWLRATANGPESDDRSAEFRQQLRGWADAIQRAVPQGPPVAEPPIGAHPPATSNGQTYAPFVIGEGVVWPGLAKLAEECGELLQVIGKIIAYPAGIHPDGGPLLALRITDELADVYAAIQFVVTANPRDVDPDDWSERVGAKLDRFARWHRGE
jgi:hypothetical protein